MSRIAESILEVHGLGVAFGGLNALTDVELAAQRDSVTAVIGPNGAGKSTLFNAITGLVRPQAGSVTFSGKEVTGLSSHAIARQGIGRTFQNSQLFWRLNVLENVVAARYCRSTRSLAGRVWGSPSERRAFRKDIEAAAQVLQLVGMRTSRMGEMPASLPYGDRRRLEIARALATEPSLLLLDEPAAGMNASEREQIFILVQQLCRSGISILMVEHDMELVMNLADKIMVLDFGRAIAEGTPSEIRQNTSVIDAYLGTG